MISVWAARNGTRTRMRLQAGPFDRTWPPEWELRSGVVPDDTWALLQTSDDEVEIEKLHHDIWFALTPLQEGS